MSYVSTVLADSPNGFWLLSEASGNFADQTANALTLTANGSITYGALTGYPGAPKGITLNGNTANNATHADNALLDAGGTTFSVEAVISPAAIGSVITVVSKGSASAVNSYDLAVSTTGKLRGDSNWTGTVQVTGGTTLVAGTFYHVVLAMNTGVNGTWTLYLNGAQDGQGTSSVALGDTTGPFTVGANNVAGTASQPWNGTLAAVAVYPSLLTGAKATAHYNALIASVSSAVLKGAVPPAMVARLLARKHPQPKGKPPAPQPPPVHVPPRFVEGEREKKES